MKNATVLIFANKMDIDKAIPVSELMKLYQIDKIKNQEWHVQVKYFLFNIGLLSENGRRTNGRNGVAIWKNCI